MRLKATVIVLIIISQLVHFNSVNGKNVRIIYSNNVDGYLRACHCPGNLFGGLIYAMDKVSNLQDEAISSIFVDAGDLFPAKNWQPKADYAIEYYNQMDVDLLNMGDQEFWLGIDFLLKKRDQANFTFLSGNLLIDGEAVFDAYKIIERDGFKIAIIGVADESAFHMLNDSVRSRLSFIDPIIKIKELISEVKKQSGLVVLLSHCGLEKDRVIAESVTGIDLIIGAHSEILLEKPEVINNTRIYQAGKYAHYIGTIDINYSQDNLFTYKDRLHKLEGVPISSEAAAIYQRYLSASDKYLEEISKKLSSLNTTYNSAPTNGKCGQCHFDQYNEWAHSAHAIAWETIEKDGRTNDISCIACHTTLFDKEGGYLNQQVTPKLVNVGCVSCHIKYEGHEEDPTLMGKVREETCTECHDKPNSPEFIFADYRTAVSHEMKYHTIKKDEWLSKLAKEYYGDVKKWELIHRVNTSDIANPDLIFPDQKIVIPKRPFKN